MAVRVISRRNLMVLAFLAVAGLSAAAASSYLLVNGMLVGPVSAAVKKAVESRTGLSLALGRLRPAPFGTLVLDAASIRERTGQKILSADRVTLHLNLLSWLAHRGRPSALVSRVDLVKPRLRLSRESDGSWSLSRYFQQGEGWQGTLVVRDGEVTVEGWDPVAEAFPTNRAGRPAGRVRLTGIRGVVVTGPAGRVRADLAGKTALLPGATVSARARLGGSEPGQVEFTLAGVELAAIQGMLPGSSDWGRISAGRGDFRGSLALDRNPRLVEVKGTIHGATWRYPALAAPLSEVSGEFSWRDGTINLSRASFTFLETRWTADGRVESSSKPVLDLRVSAENASLKALADALPDSLRRQAELDGRVSLELAARGPLRDPLLTGFVRLSGAAVSLARWSLPLADLNGTVELVGDGLRAQRLTARLAGGQASVSGEVRDWSEPHGSLQVRLAGVPSEGLRRALPAPVARKLAPLADGLVSASLELEGSLAHPAVEGRVSVIGARWGDLPVESVEVTGAYARGRVNLPRVTVVAAGGRLEGMATAAGLTTDSPSYAFSGELEQVDAAQLASAGGLRLPVAVSGRVSAVVAGQGEGTSWESLSVSGNLSLTGGELGGERITAARAGFSLMQGETSLDYLTVSSPDGELSGYARRSAGGQLSGVLTGRRVKLSALSRHFQGLPLDGTADVLAQLSGTTNDPQLDAEFDLLSPSFRGETFAAGRGRVRLTRRQLSLEEMLVQRGDSSLRAAGTVGLGPDHPLDLAVSVERLAAEEILPLAGVQADLTGAADGAFTLTGPARAPVVAGQVELSGGQVSGHPYRLAAADFRYAGDMLELKRLTVEGDGFAAAGRGRLRGQELDLAFEADRLDFSRLPLPGKGEGAWRGSGSFRGTVRGTLRQPVLEGQLTGAGVAYQAYAVDALRGGLRYRDGRLTVTEVSFERGTGRYLLTGEIEPGPGRMDLRLRFDQGDLGDLARVAAIRLPYPLTGRASGVLHVWGGFRDPSARLIAETDDARLGGALLAGDVDLSLRDGEVTINRLRLGDAEGEGLVVALGRLGRSQVDLEAKARRINLGPLAAALGLKADVSGRADAELTVRGASDDPQASLTVTVADARVNGVALDEVRGEATYSGGAVRLNEVVVANGEHRLTAVGTWPLPAARLAKLGLKAAERPWDLAVAMPRGDLSLLSLVLPELRVSGPGSLELRLTGPAGAPQVAGEVVADGVKVVHPALRGEITRLEGRVELGPDGVKTRGLTGVYNGGEARLSGQVTLAGLAPKNLDLTLTGRNVHYRNPVFEAWIDADLTVQGPLEESVISGRAVLDRSTLTLGANLPPRKVTWNPQLNIAVSSREDMRVTTVNRVIDARAYGSVTLRGRMASPALTGEAEASRGTFVYLDTPFQITRGQAVFSAYRGMLPTLDVTAETTLSWRGPGSGPAPSEEGDSGAAVGGVSPSPGGNRTLKVKLNVTGPVGQLSLNLSSDPPLSQAEITAALSLPGEISRIMGGDNTAGDREAGLLRVASQQLSNRLFSGLELAVADALQLDELTLVPGFREKNLQLHFGKYLVDNVYLTYTRTFDLDPWENIGLEYRIYHGLTFTSSFDNQGEFKWAIEARHRF